MEFVKTEIEGVIRIIPLVHKDHRGFFLESYSLEKFKKAGINTIFVQDNHSYSKERGVLRGLHFQKPPYAQAKLIRVTRGKVFDVVVDLRKNSPTFGKWLGFELSEDNFEMLYVPAGFAHGFCTLVPDTHVQYKVDVVYAPQYDSGIIWNDPNLGIKWPIQNPILSEKDSKLPSFENFSSPF
ncbi:MAG: dTDP-4-dehydrorhamnose 3,5-epimerase [Chitinispirillaceae bacterium]|nr:dTDP-4-dehydrorhamnose 3,5-epimerase [Chitinispirillaceae bacterium]